MLQVNVNVAAVQLRLPKLGCLHVCSGRISSRCYTSVRRRVGEESLDLAGEDTSERLGAVRLRKV